MREHEQAARDGHQVYCLGRFCMHAIGCTWMAIQPAVMSPHAHGWAIPDPVWAACARDCMHVNAHRPTVWAACACSANGPHTQYKMTNRLSNTQSPGKMSNDCQSQKPSLHIGFWRTVARLTCPPDKHTAQVARSSCPLSNCPLRKRY
jgi:hypothetical protein